MNEIIASRLPDEGTDALIDEAIATYRRLGIRFRWTVPPGAHPPDLADRLARRALTRSEALGMACSITAPPSMPSSVEEVSLANVDAFTEVMAEGWQMDPAPLDTLHRRMLTTPPHRQHLFLARAGDTPAAVASYVSLPRSAYLIGAVVLPAHRGKGLYRALVAARLAHAHSRALPLATSLARAETSAPILTHLGFKTICKIPVFTSE